MKDFVGQNFRGMLIGLQERYNLEIPDIDEYVDKELGKVIQGLEERAQPCEGATDVVAKLFEQKEYGLTVVSSSALPRVRASLKKVGQDKYFPYEHVYSAATSLPTPTSKPDPAIYLYACDQIGAQAAECLAIEDSKSGATAAMRAKIPLIGYVGAYDKDEQDEKAAMLKKECGAITVMYHWSDFEKSLKMAEAA